MNKNEYWFLDAAVIHSVPLYFLPRKEVLEIDLNRPTHGQSSSEVVKTLAHLFQRGDIIGCGHLLEDFVPTLDQIEEGLMEGQDIDDLQLRKDKGFSYKLTPQGGAVWEEVSVPNWDLFHTESSCVDYELQRLIPNRWQLESGSRSLINEVVSSRLWGKQLIAGTEEWVDLVPWQATYWKVLSTGYQLTFQYNSVDVNEVAWHNWYSLGGRRWYESEILD